LATQQAEDNNDGDENDDDGAVSSPLPELDPLPTRRKKETKAQSSKRKQEEEVDHAYELPMILSS
jgi:hypothetical protein